MVAVDTYVAPGPGLHATVAACVRAEAAGHDRLWVGEVDNDPFLPLVLAAEHTEHIELATGIATAFPRSPLHLALTAHDLQVLSRGRFTLGLGSQVRAHVERRLGGTWDRPVTRMRSLVCAVRAIWTAWNDGGRLDFHDEFFDLDLMPPRFRPEPSAFGRPGISLAAVGPRMTELAGEQCDGVLVHGFTTARYLDEVTLPALERGLAVAGRSRTGFEVSGPVLVATGEREADVAAELHRIRQTIGFYASTPQYRSVLELHGWTEVATRASALVREDRWGELAGLIDGEVVNAVAVVGKLDDLPSLLAERVGGRLDRISFALPDAIPAGRRREILAAVRAAAR